MRILVTVPWGEPLGGAEAMLQAVLDGAQDETASPPRRQDWNVPGVEIDANFVTGPNQGELIVISLE